MTVDMWYGDKIEDVTSIDINFSDADCVYRGNCFIGDKVVGDYSTTVSTEIEDTFKHLIQEDNYEL